MSEGRYLSTFGRLLCPSEDFQNYYSSHSSDDCQSSDEWEQKTINPRIIRLSDFRIIILLSLQMGEISRFFGIIIQMYGEDHNPPHFHVTYGEYRAIIEIQSGESIQGLLPSKQLKYVQVWADIHKEELLENFNKLNAEIKTYAKIKPLE